MSELCDNTEAGKQPGTRETDATIKKVIKKEQINGEETKMSQLNFQTFKIILSELLLHVLQYWF